MDAKFVKKLADKIYKAKVAYYQKGSPIMSDTEYDALERNLEYGCPTHPILKMVGFDLMGNYKKPSLIETEELLNASKNQET